MCGHDSECKRALKTIADMKGVEMKYIRGEGEVRGGTKRSIQQLWKKKKKHRTKFQSPI